MGQPLFPFRMDGCGERHRVGLYPSAGRGDQCNQAPSCRVRDRCTGRTPAWDEVRGRAQRKAIEMRSQGWSGAAMLPYSELEYGGFRDTVSGLLKRFRLREERKPEAAE
jgi:hypothetical protein